MKTMKTQAFVMIILIHQICGLTSALATISDPQISLTSSNSQQTVAYTVSQAQGNTLYYTTDGSSPTTSSATIAAGSSILVSQNSSLKVQAFQGSSASNLVTARYGVKGTTAAGNYHTLFLKMDGTVWAYGSSSYGQLGNGGYYNSSQPVQVLTSGYTPLTGIVAIAAGTDESFAVDGNGNVWAWGYNEDGELGIGTTTDTSVATQVVNSGGTPVTGFVSITSSQYHTLGLRSDGTVWGWGANNIGQLGTGATALWVNYPVEVSGVNGGGQYLQGIVAVAAGAYHSLAVDNQGNVYAWGDNTNGALGNGDSSGTPQLKPVHVKLNGASLTGTVAVAAGTAHSMALGGNGNVYAWGDNKAGELGNGDGTGQQQNQAIHISGLSGITAIAAGNNFSRAIASNGNSWAWGDNSAGQMGVGIPGSFATLPLLINSPNSSALTLASTAGSGQSVTDGSFTMSPVTVTATVNGNPAPGALITFVAPGGGLFGLNGTATALSGIYQLNANSSGQASLYYEEPATGTGTSQVFAASGAAQTPFTFTAAAAALATGEPTMPQWMLIIMAGFLVYAATRQKERRRASL